MIILFCTLLFDNLEQNIRESVVSVPLSGHIYQENMIDGLKSNKVNLQVLNTQRVNKFPYYPKKKFEISSFYFKGEKIGINIPFNNKPIIHFFSKVYNLYKELVKQIKKENDNELIVLIYNTPITILLASLLAKIRYPNIHLCASIGDIPGKLGVAVQVDGFKRFKLSCINYIERNLIRKFDSFVFVTKYMAKALRVESKPHIIIEGLYKVVDREIPKDEASHYYNALNFSNEKKIIFYAGGIDIDYDMEHLLKSFSMIKNDSYILLIAGDGNAVDLVHKYQACDSRIKYLGLITPEDVSKYEKISTVIINPRKSEKEFVRYSFPSKTFGSLASGIPFISHKLPCYSPEYDQYIQFAKDESDKALMEKIIEVCEMTQEKRNEIGEKNRNFIKKQKNHVVLTKKIIQMWKNSF